MRVRRAIETAATMALALIVGLFALEIVFRFLPVAIGPPIQPPSVRDPIQRYGPEAAFTWSTGWNFRNVVHGRTNGQGFVADEDYAPRAATPLVVVLGDGLAEGLAVPFAQSITGRLQAMLGANARAYAFAQSGAQLAQYVAYARQACAVYRPQKLVVVIANGDVAESLIARRPRPRMFQLSARADGGFDHRLTPPDPSTWRETILQNSALALYLVRNVGLPDWVGLNAADAAEPRALPGLSVPTDPAGLAEGERVVSWFLTALPDAACLTPPDIVLAFDALRPAIYDDTALAVAQAGEAARLREALIAQASAKGFVVVDLDQPFRARFSADKQRFEFSDDVHWNAVAHQVAAEAVRRALGDWPPPTAAWR